MFDGFRFDFEDVVEDIAVGNVAGLLGSGPCREDSVDGGCQGVCKYFGIGVGSG